MKRASFLIAGSVAVLVTFVGFATANPPLMILPLPVLLIVMWLTGLTKN